MYEYALTKQEMCMNGEMKQRQTKLFLSKTFQSRDSKSGLVWFLCLMAYQLFFRLFNAKAILLEEK